jgi:hypothetical protein
MVNFRPCRRLASGDAHWSESFIPLSSFGSSEQEGGEDEDEYNVKNDDDGEDDDREMGHFG